MERGQQAPKGSCEHPLDLTELDHSEVSGSIGRSVPKTCSTDIGLSAPLRASAPVKQPKGRMQVSFMNPKQASDDKKLGNRVRCWAWRAQEVVPNFFVPE